MPLTIRPGQPQDLEFLAGWTKNTFDWGDYVADRFLEWLTDPRGLVLVAVDDREHPIGLGRAVMLSNTEAWFHAARVHPEHRRSGVATAINDHAVKWAASKGALVTRLLVEDSNQTSRAHVTRNGYREVVHWVSACRSPRPTASIPEAMALNPANRAEVAPAWISWSRSDLAKAARGFYSMGWYMRTMTANDVENMAREARLYQCPMGWVEIVERENELWFPWIVTTEEDAPAMITAISNLATRNPGASGIRLMFPAIEWMQSAAAAAGYSFEPMSVFEMPTRASCTRSGWRPPRRRK